jgi:hypothetical protein
MVVILESLEERPIERGEDDEFPQFHGHHGHMPSQSREVVRVRVANLPDQSVGAQAFEHSRDSSGSLSRQHRLEASVLKATNAELAPAHGAERVQISCRPAGVIERCDEFLCSSAFEALGDVVRN